MEFTFVIHFKNNYPHNVFHFNKPLSNIVKPLSKQFKRIINQNCNLQLEANVAKSSGTILM